MRVFWLGGRFCGVARFWRFGWGSVWGVVLCCLSFLVGILCVLWVLWSCGVCLGGVVSSVVMFGARGDVSLSGSGFLLSSAG